jgi:hypothetical protein
MGSRAGIVVVGEKPVLVCTVPQAGVLVKNLGEGSPDVYLGGPDVTAGDGYVLEAGHPGEQIMGRSRVRQTPVVPAPPGDADDPALYGITDPGAGESRVSWISAGG